MRAFSTNEVRDKPTSSAGLGTGGQGDPVNHRGFARYGLKKEKKQN